MRRRDRSALVYVLVALIPYSRPNLALAFKPNKFFNDLERLSGYKTATLKAAYKRGEEQNLYQLLRGKPKLTKEGKRKILKYTATKLSRDGHLMIIFDIPENRRGDRQRLRNVLRDWGFKQIQKSVWSSKLDYRDDLMDVVSELGLGGYVQIYESARLFP